MWLRWLVRTTVDGIVLLDRIADLDAPVGLPGALMLADGFAELWVAPSGTVPSSAVRARGRPGS